MKRLNKNKYDKIWINTINGKYNEETSNIILKNAMICKLASISEFITVFSLYFWVIEFLYALALTLITRYIFWYFNLDLYFCCYHNVYKNYPEMLEIWEDEKSIK